MASHLYDLIQYFAGPIRKITALTGNLVQDYQSEDASTTLLELQSGAQATVDCFFCIPDEASRTRLEIYGSGGAVLAEERSAKAPVENSRHYSVQVPAVTTPSNRRTFRGSSSESHSQRSIPIRPSAAILPIVFFVTSRRLINGIENSLQIMTLIEKAYASAKTGRTSRVDNHDSKNVKPVA